jgi:hypothetical protein
MCKSCIELHSWEGGLEVGNKLGMWDPGTCLIWRQSLHGLSTTLPSILDNMLMRHNYQLMFNITCVFI